MLLLFVGLLVLGFVAGKIAERQEGASTQKGSRQENARP